MEKRCLICKKRLEENAFGKYTFMCSECVEHAKNIEETPSHQEDAFFNPMNNEINNLKDKLTENAHDILFDCYEKFTLLENQNAQYLK